MFISSHRSSTPLSPSSSSSSGLGVGNKVPLMIRSPLSPLPSPSPSELMGAGVGYMVPVPIRAETVEMMIEIEADRKYGRMLFMVAWLVDVVEEDDGIYGMRTLC